MINSSIVLKFYFCIFTFANVGIFASTSVPIKIYEGFTIIGKYNVIFNDKFYLKSAIINLNINAKLLYLAHSNDLEAIIEKYADLYNNRWVVMIQDYKTLLLMMEYLNRHPTYIKGLILYDYLEDLYNSTEYPVFIVGDGLFKKLIKYDIGALDGNYFVNIEYSNNTNENISNYLYIISLTDCVVAVIVGLIWYYLTYRLYRTQSTTLQKALSSLIYIKALLCVMIAYYIRIGITDSTPDSATLIKVYLDTIITTLESIFKTIFWFVAIMISCGWQIHRHVLNRAEMRRFIGIYIFIYLSVCFDQILDLMAEKPIGKFQVSELKNFVIYTILTLIAFYKTFKSIKFLKRKYIYSYALAPEFMESIALKIKMLYFHIIVIITFTISYISMTLMQKFIFANYSTNIMTLVNNQSLELIILVFYL